MYQYEYKNIKTGKVILTFSVTDKLKKLADIYGLPYEVTKIGFKYIAEIMAEEDDLLVIPLCAQCASKVSNHSTGEHPDWGEAPPSFKIV